MKVFTIQLSSWRKARARSIPFVNTTVKSGRGQFAPSWEMVRGIKNGEISEDQYTSLYLERMQRSVIENPDHWSTLLAMPEVAVSCYCGAGKFCHRHLLVDFIEGLCNERNIPFERGGEIQ